MSSRPSRAQWQRISSAKSRRGQGLWSLEEIVPEALVLRPGMGRESMQGLRQVAGPGVCVEFSSRYVLGLPRDHQEQFRMLSKNGANGSFGFPVQLSTFPAPTVGIDQEAD